MSNQKVKRLIIGRSGRRYLLHVEEMKYKHLQNVAAHNNKSLNRQINELIDLGLQTQGVQNQKGNV